MEITNKGQSNLAIGGIAMNWGFYPYSQLPAGLSGPLPNTVLLETTRVSLPNGISFRPTALAVHEYDRRRTDGQTTLR